MTEMPVEAVVSRFSSQPGLRMLTYREVGLPYWDVPIRCRLLAKKSLSTIDEFVLRCIDADQRTDTDVAQFLGISQRVVQGVMGGLLSSGHIAAAQGTAEGSVLFSLSERGKRALLELSEVTAEERTIGLSFDGLLHTFSLVDKPLRWRPRDLRDNGMLEIPAFPADPPEVGPSDTASIARVVGNVRGLERHELLSALGVGGQREKFFIRAVALVFETADAARDVTVQFAIDGRASQDHDRAFARAEGQRKLGIVESLRSGGSTVADSILTPEILARRQDGVEVSALRRASETLRVRIGELEREGAESGSRSVETSDSLSQQVEELQAKLDEAEASLARVPARLLEVHEHAGLLDEALQSAQDRLLIVSPWIRAAVVNDDFVRRLTTLLEQSVEVRIAYGINDGKSGGEKDVNAERRLHDMARTHSNFHCVRLGDTHAKILLVDNRFLVATSFNWLSFRGDPKRPFRDERGTYVTVPSEIERIYQDYSSRMDAGQGADASRSIS